MKQKDKNISFSIQCFPKTTITTRTKDSFFAATFARAKNLMKLWFSKFQDIFSKDFHFRKWPKWVT